VSYSKQAAIVIVKVIPAIRIRPALEPADTPGSRSIALSLQLLPIHSCCFMAKICQEQIARHHHFTQ